MYYSKFSYAVRLMIDIVIFVISFFVLLNCILSVQDFMSLRGIAVIVLFGTNIYILMYNIRSILTEYDKELYLVLRDEPVENFIKDDGVDITDEESVERRIKEIEAMDIKVSKDPSFLSSIPDENKIRIYFYPKRVTLNNIVFLVLNILEMIFF